MNMTYAIVAFVGVFCLYLVFDAMRVNAQRKKSMRERIAADGVATGNEYVESSAGFSEEMSSNALGLLKILNAMGISTRETIAKLEVRFARAGINSKDAPVYYLFFQRILSFVFALVGIALIINAGDDDSIFGMGILVTFLAIFGPNLYLKNKTDHRQKKLQRAFPDTLDLLLICVESGLALDAALNRVCNELAKAYPEMAGELNRTRLELSLLNDRVRALMNLGDRTDMVAFRSLVVALVQSERFGTSLTDTLRVLAEDFRLQRLAAVEAKAARLPTLMTVPLMACLMPAFMIIILGPAIINIMNSGAFK